MTPVVVTKENMQTVFDDGNAKVAEVCTGEVAAAVHRGRHQVTDARFSSPM